MADLPNIAATVGAIATVEVAKLLRATVAQDQRHQHLGENIIAALARVGIEVNRVGERGQVSIRVYEQAVLGRRAAEGRLQDGHDGEQSY